MISSTNTYTRTSKRNVYFESLSYEIYVSHSPLWMSIFSSICSLLLELLFLCLLLIPLIDFFIHSLTLSQSLSFISISDGLNEHHHKGKPWENVLGSTLGSGLSEHLSWAPRPHRELKTNTSSKERFFFL